MLIDGLKFTVLGSTCLTSGVTVVVMPNSVVITFSVSNSEYLVLLPSTFVHTAALIVICFVKFRLLWPITGVRPWDVS